MPAGLAVDAIKKVPRPVDMSEDVREEDVLEDMREAPATADAAPAAGKAPEEGGGCFSSEGRCICRACM